MSKKAPIRKAKLRIKGKTLAVPSTSVAAICGVAIFQYTEFFFMPSSDDIGHSVEVPSWRVHMGSAWLGIIGFVIALFCLEVLVRGSKTIAFRSIVPWLPFVVFTGVATLFHLHFLVVIAASLAYGGWMYRRRKRILPVADL